MYSWNIEQMKDRIEELEDKVKELESSKKWTTFDVVLTFSFFGLLCLVLR